MVNLPSFYLKNNRSVSWRGLLFFCQLVFVSLLFGCGAPAQEQETSAHPNLVITQESVKLMRGAIKESGSFTEAYQALKADVDAQMAAPMEVPVPKDGGGGYTHERHKKNYQLMFNAGIIYQLSEEAKYAEYVTKMLLEYAELYPTLDVHPARKVNSQNPGKFFWQSLNEAVWLVYTIQAYDLIVGTLDEQQRTTIEDKLLKPVSIFLSDGQPSTFNKVHNHGTWATAGVGMAGFVLNEPEWVEKALYDLEKSGKGGFLRQLDELFSPQGYYNEGPYYQRYALFPFVTFGKAIENNQPERKIFDYRDGVLLKAIDTTIQLSYAGLFYPINDAIKSKGIDTIELVHGVTIAYGLTGDNRFLDIAQQQKQVILSGDGLKVAQAIDQGKTEKYQFRSVAFGDGNDGKQGALVIMRSETDGEQAVLFKPAAQGLGHGHFDKLTWQFYDHGQEIVSDYAAARFLNVEAKFGGRYLPENNSYAKQTVAHNTVVIDETSHFDAKVEVGNANWPVVDFFANNEHGSVSKAHINTAYEGVALTRTIALVDLPDIGSTIAIDLFDVDAQKTHQMDLPLHYLGQFIDSNFDISANTTSLPALGDKSGYQHLWLRGQATPQEGLARVTWLNDNGRFYSQTSLVDGNESFLFTQVGAGDPNFNLRNEHSFIRRVEGKKQHRFVSILEAHGEYNPSKEYTLEAESRVTALSVTATNGIDIINVNIADKNYVIAINTNKDITNDSEYSFEYLGKTHKAKGRLVVVGL
jgi:hypothetical protein